MESGIPKDTNPPGKEEKVPGSSQVRIPSAEEEKHHEQANPPGKEEKLPSFDPQKQSETTSKAKCTIHNASKEVFCTECQMFFCCRCMVEHLQDKHKIQMFKTIDDLKENLKEKLSEKINGIQESQKGISEIKNKLVQAAAAFRDDKKLDALYKEIEANLKTTINGRKKEKNELHSRMNKLARDLDTKECYHTTKLNLVKEDKKNISDGKAEAVIEWTEKLAVEGVFIKGAERKKGGEAKDVVMPGEGKLEGQFVQEAEDKKEGEVPKVKEADNNAEFEKKVQEILTEAEEMKKEEMKSTLEQIEMHVIHKFYTDHFHDEIVQSTKLLEDYKKEAEQLKAEVDAKKKLAKEMEEVQVSLQKQIEEVEKQIKDGRSYLNTINVQYYKQEDERIKQKIIELNKDSETIKGSQERIKADFEPLLKSIKDGRNSLAQMKVEDFKNKAKEMGEAVAKRLERAGEIKAEQDKAINDLRSEAEKGQGAIKTLMDDCKAKADALKDQTGDLVAASGKVKAAQAQTQKELKDIADGVAKTGKEALEEIKERAVEAEALKATIQGKKKDADALKIDQEAEIAKVTQLGEEVKGAFDAQKTDLKKCLQCGKAKCIACGLKCGCNNFFCKECVPEKTKCPNCKKDFCKACLGCNICGKSCKDCVLKCPSCGKKGCKEEGCLVKCHLCDLKGCKDCFKDCRKCKKPTSPDHLGKCSACGKDSCSSCLGNCGECKKPYDKECGDIEACAKCGKLKCKTCRDGCKFTGTLIFNQ